MCYEAQFSKEEMEVQRPDNLARVIEADTGRVDSKIGCRALY